jgi:type II protein arginine methyltransferase
MLSTENGSWRVPRWHFAMMNDEGRNQAFNAAIRNSVTSDSTVLEIGTGAGLLAMMAAKQGATVFTCESIPQLASLAEEVIQHNGF